MCDYKGRGVCFGEETDKCDTCNGAQEITIDKLTETYQNPANVGNYFLHKSGDQ